MNTYMNSPVRVEIARPHEVAHGQTGENVARVLAHVFEREQLFVGLEGEIDVAHQTAAPW